MPIPLARLSKQGTLFINPGGPGSSGIEFLGDFPAEIRAPAGTLAGVSGFQVHFSSRDVLTPGDAPQVLVAMNPAALKANMKWVKDGATLIIDIERPQGGTLTVSQVPLIQLQEQIGPPSLSDTLRESTE